jgi:hypothetical protein
VAVPARPRANQRRRQRIRNSNRWRKERTVPALKFDKFGGQIPAIDDRLLPELNAAYAENAYLQAGNLEPLAADIAVHTLVDPVARFAFRVPIAHPGIDNIVDSYWLEFENADTSVVRSPVADLADGGRFYWANASAPPGYTTKARLQASQPPLILGIPRPPVAPGATPSGGAAPTITRAYAYTWVSDSGEEGQPSPPKLVAGANTNASWALTFTAPTTLDTTNRALSKTRIYRTESGPDGNADFFFVAEIPIATLAYTDTISSDIVANSGAMLSTDWSPPPTDLKGLVSMPNGMVAGWKDNEVWFCEPYRPHAWPTKYTINVEFPIVGLGTIDQNCMVLTSGQPYVAMGIHPEVIALRQVQPIEPCTSQGSIVSTPQGVLYTSYNGLILIGPTGARNLTFNIIRKDEWLNLVNLNTLHATYFMNGYYTYSGAVDGVFQDDTFQVDDAFQQENFKGTMVGAHISLTDERLGFMTLTCDSPTFNVMLDQWTGETLVIRSGKVFHVDRRMYAPRQSYKWRSKVVETPFVENFSAVKIMFSQPNGPPSDLPTTFRYYANGVLRYQRPVVKSGEQFRLPSGFKTDTVQFELEGQYMIHNMQVATSPRELRQV